MADTEKPVQQKAVSNGIPPPDLDLPYPDKHEIITDNLLKLTELAPDERTRFIFKNLINHVHSFVTETNITTAEWRSAIEFLTRTGQTCTPLRQEFILLSDILGVSAVVDAINNPNEVSTEPGKRLATESSVLGPFFTPDAPDVAFGDAIASEGKGEYLYVEGRVLDTSGKPVPNATIETWETDENGFYDTQYAERDHPDCRGRLKANSEGYYQYRAVVPVAYPIPGDGPVGDLLLKLGRHNMRPNHLHLMITADGFSPLTTALYPEGDIYLASDAVFGVKKSLVVSYKDISNEDEVKKRGYKAGGKGKLLEFDIVLSTVEENEGARRRFGEAQKR